MEKQQFVKMVEMAHKAFAEYVNSNENLSKIYAMMDDEAKEIFRKNIITEIATSLV